MMRGKKGSVFGMILFFIVLLSLIIIGFIAVMIWGISDIAMDELNPIMTDLGVVGDSNVSQYAEYSFGTANTFFQALPWIIALGYVMALIFTLVFIFLVGYQPHPAFLAFYFALMILLIFGCIIMSNMYQDIYIGTDDLALRLQEQTIMSYMLLHSPAIMVIISVIGGILMFTRMASGEAGAGGFGI